MEMKHHIGLKVKSARRSAGLTQEELSEMIGKSVETVSNLERGKYMTGFETLQHVAQSLNVPLSYFFEEVEDKRHTNKRRVQLELELQRLGVELSDRELHLAIRLVAAIKDDHRP